MRAHGQTMYTGAKEAAVSRGKEQLTISSYLSACSESCVVHRRLKDHVCCHRHGMEGQAQGQDLRLACEEIHVG